MPFGIKHVLAPKMCLGIKHKYQSHVEDLLAGAAYAGSIRYWCDMRAREPADANGTFARVLRREWGMCAWRSTIRLLHDRLSYVGHGAMRASGRRAVANDSACVGYVVWVSCGPVMENFHLEGFFNDLFCAHARRRRRTARSRRPIRRRC